MAVDGLGGGRRRVAVVTGASRGLGLSLATALAERGWDLVIDARSADRLAVAERRLARVTRVVAVCGDVSDAGHRAEIAAAARSMGGAELLVNNAATLDGSPPPALADLAFADLRRSFEVNALAPIALIQLLLPELRAKAGMVVNVSSDAAAEPFAGWGAYGASKAALDHASSVLALEEPGMSVWSVDPGGLRTQMQQEAFPGEDMSDLPLPEAVVPAFLLLVDQRRPSGRYRATALLAEQGKPVSHF